MRTSLVKTVLVCFVSTIAVGRAQENTSGEPVHIVITAEPHHHAAEPSLTAQDIQVYHGNDRLSVADAIPARGDQAALEFYILIDDGANTDIGSQFSDIRKFIDAQPPTTQIGLGYLRNGTVDVIQPLTANHAQVSKAIRLPFGMPGVSASPYISLSELIKKWPERTPRREVLMITSGLDLYSDPDPENPYLLHAIADAQRSNVIVHSIYYPARGHAGHSFWRINWGQNYLSEIGDATGGEAYWQGNISPVAFEPYLNDLTQRLQNQYLVSVIAHPTGKKELLPIKLATEVHDVSLEGPSKIYVH